MRAEINFGTRKLKSKIPRSFYGDSGFRRNGAKWWRRAELAAGGISGGGAAKRWAADGKRRAAELGGDLPFSPLTFVGGVSFREVYFALTFGMLDSRLRGNDGDFIFSHSGESRNLPPYSRSHAPAWECIPAASSPPFAARCYNAARRPPV